MENAAQQQAKERLSGLLQHLQRLGPTEKLLIGSLAVILMLALFLVAQYAGQPSQVVAMTISDAGNRAAALTFLRGSGIPATSSDTGEVFVPDGQAVIARAMLQENQVVPMESMWLVDELREGQNWMNSRQDNHQQSVAARAKMLSMDLSRWRALRSAAVHLDVPEPGGLGRTHRDPRASVMVHSQNGELSPETVDAIAATIVGSVAGMRPEHVAIVDGATGMAYHARDARVRDSRFALEQRSQYEGILEDKIRELLRDIPGLSLSVLARLDNARRTQQSETFEKPVTGIVSEFRKETSQENTSRGGVGGTRSNEAMSISQGSAAGTSLTESEEKSDFEARFGKTVEQSEDPGGDVESVSVMLGVPRSYVRRLLELEQLPPAEGEEPAQPSPQQISQRFGQVSEDLEATIQKALAVIVTNEATGVAVTVSMLNDAGGTALGGAAFGASGPLGGAGGGGLGLGGGLIDKAVLGVLAVVSVGMMLMLVRRATKKAELPTPEELVGVPPALQGDGDLFGEAEEGEIALAGIELEDEKVHASKMLEQVGDLIESSPEMAAGLLGNWIRADDD
ncbi:MAG: flagellar M-ring protein FliF C-terminal domain-containing protein [Planctomycetota bacterium]